MVTKTQKTERTVEAADIGKTLEQAVADANSQLQEALKAGTAMAEKVMGFGKDRLETVARTCEEVGRANQRGVSAIVASGNAAVAGAGTLNAEWLAFAKANVDSSLAQAKALTKAKTLKDVVELQSDFVRSAFEACFKAGSKFGEVSAQVAEATLAPMDAEWRSGVNRLIKAAA